MTCKNAQIEYDGNGSQVDYTFPFQYEYQEEVVVEKWVPDNLDYSEVVDRSEWTFQEATKIRFNTAPDYKFRIARTTNLDQLRVVFAAGSSIRAQDLNANFEQLRDAIQEGWCRVSEEFFEYLNNYIWDTRDTWYEEDQITGDVTPNDEKISTSAALARRYDTYTQDETSVTPDIRAGR